MAALMDLIAGSTREILLAISVDDWPGLQDRQRFEAYVSLGGSMDPIWLDLFSQAARDVTGSSEPGSFERACYPLEGIGGPLVGDRTVERISRSWIEAVALIPDGRIDRVASRWIDLIDREETTVDPEDKPMLRALTADLVAFARGAEPAEDVLFAWSL